MRRFYVDTMRMRVIFFERHDDHKPMLRANPNLRSIAVLVSLLITCLVGATILRTTLGRPVVPTGKPPVIAMGWSISTSAIRDIHFSNSGQYVSTVTADGKVTCYDQAGKQVFVSTVPNADRAVVSPDAKCTLVYSHLNPMNTTLTFLDSTGQVDWTMDVSGAVWSADSALCRAGAYFAVGTGNRYVYLVTIGPRAKRYRRWRAPGAVVSVVFNADSQSLTYGTWETSSICRSDLSGHRDWQNDADPACLQYVQSLWESDRLLSLSVPNNANSDGEASLLDSDGTPLATCEMDSSNAAHAISCPNGAFICVGYKKSIQHSNKSVLERHAALYDSSGRVLWDKGSMLMQLAPILVTKGGFVLVDDGKKALFVVSPSGELKQSCRLPSTMVSSIVSRDGSRALVKCANEKAYLLKITQ